MGRSAITSDGPFVFLQWLTGGDSLQWLLYFKQLGPAWNNYPAASALRAQALGYAVFGILSETRVIQDNWKPMLLNVISYLVVWDCWCFWDQSAVLSEEGPVCCIHFAVFHCKGSPCSSLDAQLSFWAFLPKIQPLQTVTLMQQVCLTSGLISNYPNLGASSFRPDFIFPS